MLLIKRRYPRITSSKSKTLFASLTIPYSTSKGDRSFDCMDPFSKKWVYMTDRLSHLIKRQGIVNSFGPGQRLIKFQMIVDKYGDTSMYFSFADSEASKEMTPEEYTRVLEEAVVKYHYDEHGIYLPNHLRPRNVRFEIKDQNVDDRYNPFYGTPGKRCSPIMYHLTELDIRPLDPDEEGMERFTVEGDLNDVTMYATVINKDGEDAEIRLELVRPAGKMGKTAITRGYRRVSLQDAYDDFYAAIRKYRPSQLVGKGTPKISGRNYEGGDPKWIVLGNTEEDCQQCQVPEGSPGHEEETDGTIAPSNDFISGTLGELTREDPMEGCSSQQGGGSDMEPAMKRMRHGSASNSGNDMEQA